MRNIMIFYSVWWFLFLGCKQPVAVERPVFLPGVYVNQYETDFCRVVDTLVVRRKSLDGTAYQVIRRSSFQRIRLGKRMPAEYEGEQWESGYDGSKKALVSDDKTKEVDYLPEENKLYRGNMGYEKVE
jgi:hypothetical protein